VAGPVVPQGEALCAGAPCLSDRESATLIADYDSALAKANAALLKLRDWIVAAGK
jgi:hypothetical protein